MKSFIKRLIRKLPFSLSRVILDRDLPRLSQSEEWAAMGRPLVSAQVALQEWEAAGRPMPPPHVVKQGMLRDCAQKHGLKILVETGTYYGDMLAALQNDFNLLYSVELSWKLHRQAKRRFQGQQKIRLIRGDSGKKLAMILKEINEPALFWLDGHFSGGSTARGETDTPVFEELRLVLTHGKLRHAILVDDARLFGKDPSYPTIDAMKSFVFSTRNDFDFTVHNDIIHITPK